MIKAESFKVLEASLADRLTKTLQDLTKDIYSEVVSALQDGNHTLAEEHLQRISLASMFEGNEDYVQYMTNLAMLFGASRVTANPGTSVVGLGFEKHTATQLIQTFKQTITQRGELQLKAVGLQLIATHRLIAAGDTAVHKEDRQPWDRPEMAIDPSTGKKRRILQPFDSFMDESGKAFLNIASSLHTSRVSAYGFTAEAMALGLVEYQINEQLDARTCPVCRHMHGKKFKVKDARALLDISCRVTDPEDLKQLQPWPKQSKEGIAALEKMTTAELVSAGFHVPPFHPRCRGLLARVGKAPTLEQLDKGMHSDQPYTATSADFEALGFKLSADSIKHWNTSVPLAPAEVIATLRGQSTEDFLSGLLQATSPKEYHGVFALNAKKEYVNIALSSNLFGSKGAVDQEITIKGKSMILDSLAMAEVDQGRGIAKKYMQRLYNLSSDLGMEKIELSANMELGGYAWAKYGFRPDLKQWEALKKDIWKGLNSGVEIKKLPEEARFALQAVLQSPDPAMIYFLSDIVVPTSTGVALGEQALAGTLWHGELNFNDEEAMTRFLTYIGELQ